MLNDLPKQVQDEARAGFERWKANPRSVGWKRLSGMHADVYSVEIGRRWRALGVVSKEHDAVVWMFVGSHETYNRYIDIHRQMTNNSWLHAGLLDRLKLRQDKQAPSPRAPGRTRPVHP